MAAENGVAACDEMTIGRVLPKVISRGREKFKVKTVNGPEQSGKAQQRTHNHHHQIGTESVKVKLLLSDVSGALTCE